MFALLILALSALLQTSGSDPYCENMIYLNNDIRELKKEIKSISTEVQELKDKCKDTSTNISAVAFNAHFSRYNVSVGNSDAFKFDTVVTNIGNGYNSTTGVFTAPVDGVYILFQSVMNEPGLGWIEAVLSVNGNLQCFTRAEATIRGDSDGFDDGFCSTVTRLSRGHTVFARRYSGGTYVHVAFAVHLSRNDVNVGENSPIVFDTVDTNIGQGYNIHTGAFTAPKSGVYIFFVQIMNEPKRGAIGVGLSVNGVIKCKAWADKTEYDDGFCTTITYVHKGDKVFAKQIDSSTYLYGNMWSSFGGARLSG